MAYHAEREPESFWKEGKKVGRYDTGGADFEGESFDVSGVLLICYLDIVYCNLFAENV